MSLDAKEHAQQARDSYNAKYDGDQFSAVNFLEDFIGKGKGKADVQARAALKFVLSVWNTGYDDEDALES